MSRYSLAELADLTGIQPRTIRSYIEKGIIPGPKRPGRHAYYEDEHLDRLRALVALRDLDKLTLDEVRRKLLGLTQAEIRSIAREGFPDAYTSPDAGDAEESLEDYIRRAREELAASRGVQHYGAAAYFNLAEQKEPRGRLALGSTPSMGEEKNDDAPVSRMMASKRVQNLEPLPYAASNHGPMARLSESMDSSSFEAPELAAAIQRIKAQLLPRLTERLDPELPATVSQEELVDELRPIIMELLAESKITLNRREQFTLERLLVEDIAGREVTPSRHAEGPHARRSHAIISQTQTRIEVTPVVDLVIKGELETNQLRRLESIAADLRDQLLGKTDDY